jgi:hypothetical protein
MDFFINEFSKFALFWLLSYGLGNWVFYKNIKVNYTRKIYHFSLLFIPLFFSNIFKGQFTPYSHANMCDYCNNFATTSFICNYFDYFLIATKRIFTEHLICIRIAKNFGTPNIPTFGRWWGIYHSWAYR